MEKGHTIIKKITVGLIAVAATILTSAGASGEDFAGVENKDIGLIPFLERVQIVETADSPYGNEDAEKVLRAYQQGLATENEVSRFYPAEYRDRVKQNWQRVRFSMFEGKKESMTMDFQLRDRAVMLRYKIKLN